MITGEKGSSDGNVPRIGTDEAASPLACKSQYQVCNPNLPNQTRCTSLGALSDLEMLKNGLWDFDKENIITWIMQAFGRAPPTPSVPSTLKNVALLSRSSLTAREQAALPDNQWQLEVENWHNISMGLLQEAPISIAKGPSDPRALQYLVRPKGTEQLNLCKNQACI